LLTPRPDKGDRTGQVTAGRLRSSLRGRKLLVPLALCLLKSVAVPVVGLVLVQLLLDTTGMVDDDPDGDGGPESGRGRSVFADFTFLYCALPTAASTVVIFANSVTPRGGVARRPDDDALMAMLAASSLLSLTLAAPMMFVLSVLATMRSSAIERAMPELTLGAHSLSLAGAAWIVVAFALARASAEWIETAAATGWVDGGAAQPRRSVSRAAPRADCRATSSAYGRAVRCQKEEAADVSQEEKEAAARRFDTSDGSWRRRRQQDESIRVAPCRTRGDSDDPSEI